MHLLKATLLVVPILFPFCEVEVKGTNEGVSPEPSTIPVKSVSIPEDTLPEISPDEEIPIDVLPVYSWLDANAEFESLIHRVPAPAGFRRKAQSPGSFDEWLRYLPLKPAGSPVLLYDGSQKYSQNVHHAVIQIDVGTRDLQQCADAVMRLKAEYHFAKEEWPRIHFNFSDGTKVSFDDWRRGNRPVLSNNSWSIGRGNGTASSSHSNFRKYMNLVFGYAGTATLEKELQRIEPAEIAAGDVFIRGGHPGHAVIVLDIAENETGKKQFLLAQSYMPAQEMHILKNPAKPDGDPWYQVDPTQSLYTPEWTFEWSQLRRFSSE